MSDSPEDTAPERAPVEEDAEDRPQDQDSEVPFVPDNDAGRTDASKYSSDEKVHKGEDELI
jgi:hypothetical protein